MIEYVGLFIDENGINDLINHEGKRLPKSPKNYHLTLEYMPKNLDIYKSIVDKTFKIKVVGYANNGKNSGYLVELSEDLFVYFKNVDKYGNKKVPHITMSLSKDGRAVDTANLNFKPIDPFYVTGQIRVFEVEKEKTPVK